MLSQERQYAVVCSRTPAGWQAEELGHGANLELAAVGVDIPFGEIYRRINFSEGFF